MKSVYAISISCLALIFLTGCQPLEYMYVEVNIKEGSPPVMKLSADAKFETPVFVMSIAVFVDEPGKPRTFYWTVTGINSVPSSVPLREVVYGVVPDGLTEWTEPLPLEPNAEYGLDIDGGQAGVGVTMYFTNKPGRYFGHELNQKF